MSEGGSGGSAINKSVTIANYVALGLFAFAAIYTIIVYIWFITDHCSSAICILTICHVIFSTLGCVGIICAMFITVKKIHIILGSVGSVFILIGIIIQIYVNYESYLYHFFSVHSHLGLASLLSIIVFVVLGILLATGVNCPFLQQFHGAFGLLAFILGSCALIFGIIYEMRYFTTNIEKILICVIIILALLWCIVIFILKLIQKK